MSEEHDRNDDLLERLQALPREIEPARDLWSGVEEKIAAAPRASRRGPVLLGMGAVLAAAAAAVLWVGQPSDPTPSSLQELARTDTPAPAPAPTPAPAPAPDQETELLPAEDAYLAAASELGQAIEDRRGQLPDELTKIYADNLAVVDAAISDSRAALAKNPDDPYLQEALDHAYRQKLELLQQVSQITVRS